MRGTVSWFSTNGELNKPKAIKNLAWKTVWNDGKNLLENPTKWPYQKSKYRIKFQEKQANSNNCDYPTERQFFCAYSPQQTDIRHNLIPFGVKWYNISQHILERQRERWKTTENSGKTTQRATLTHLLIYCPLTFYPPPRQNYTTPEKTQKHD